MTKVTVEMGQRLQVQVGEVAASLETRIAAEAAAREQELLQLRDRVTAQESQVLELAQDLQNTQDDVARLQQERLDARALWKGASLAAIEDGAAAPAAEEEKPDDEPGDEPAEGDAAPSSRRYPSSPCADTKALADPPRAASSMARRISAASSSSSRSSKTSLSAAALSASAASPSVLSTISSNMACVP